MIPVWPADLPQRVLADGYRENLGDGRLRTEMDTGPGKTRRRFSAVPRPVSAAFRVDANGKAWIERFWREEIGGGAKPFLLRDQVYDGLPLLTETGRPLLSDDGRPLVTEAWWVVMAGDTTPSFEPRNRGLFFLASFPFVVMP